MAGSPPHLDRRGGSVRAADIPHPLNLSFADTRPPFRPNIAAKGQLTARSTGRTLMRKSLARAGACRRPRLVHAPALTPAFAQARTDINIGIQLEPPNLDPTTGGAAAAIRSGHALNIFEGLTRLDKDGNVLPLLAESWDISEDGLTYTFHLKEGVTFSDGTPLDAEDVKCTLDRNRAPKIDQRAEAALCRDRRRRGRRSADRQGHAEPAAGRLPLQPGLGRRGDRRPKDRRRQRHQPDRHRPLQARRVGQGRPHHAGPQRSLLGHRRRRSTR